MNRKEKTLNDKERIALYRRLRNVLDEVLADLETNETKEPVTRRRYSLKQAIEDNINSGTVRNASLLKKIR